MANLNVVLQGTFGYVLRDDYMEVYSPDQHDHAYKAGSRTSPVNLVGGDWKLELGGIRRSKRPSGWPTSGDNPVIDQRPADIEWWDPLDTRFLSLRLPYPASKDDIFPLAPFDWTKPDARSVFTGAASVLLNGTLKTFPTAYAFRYNNVDPKDIELVHATRGISHAFPDLTPSPGESGGINLHVFATHTATMRGKPADTSHYRRAFAAMVNMYPYLDLFLNIPAGFSPSTIPNYKRPPGLSEDDAELKSGPGTDATMNMSNCQFTVIHINPKT